MILSGYQLNKMKRYLSKMHSYYRNAINTVEEWLDHTKEELQALYPETFDEPHNYLAISGGGSSGGGGFGGFRFLTSIS